MFLCLAQGLINLLPAGRGGGERVTCEGILVQFLVKLMSGKAGEEEEESESPARGIFSSVPC